MYLYMYSENLALLMTVWYALNMDVLDRHMLCPKPKAWYFSRQNDLASTAFDNKCNQQKWNSMGCIQGMVSAML